MQLSLTISPEPRAAARPLCFASGANEAGEIRGFVSLGIPVGVNAAELGRDALRELRRIAAFAVPVFADSGAFGEARQSRLPQIPGHEWERRLGIYQLLAAWFGSNLYAVTPDRVGDQVESLKRLATHASAVRSIAAAGASLLLPLHRGAMPGGTYHACAQDLLGEPLVPAFPMPAGRVTATEILRAIEAGRPDRVHLLGLGPRSAHARELLRVLRAHAPSLRVSMDANFVAAAVGRRPDGSAARPLTRAQDAIRARGFPDEHGEVSDPEWEIHADYTESISAPSQWMGPQRLRGIAQRAGLDARQTARWMRDPDAFLQRPVHPTEPAGTAWWEHPVLAEELDHAWRQYLARRHTAPRKAEAIRSTFASHPAAGQFTVSPRVAGPRLATAIPRPRKLPGPDDHRPAKPATVARPSVKRKHGAAFDPPAPTPA
jgi:hypothetical protein